MKEMTNKWLYKLGTEIEANGRKGMAVIYPIRYTQKESGGTDFGFGGRCDPHKYFMYSSTDIMKDMEYGHIVRCGTDEYYVLWKDELYSKFGSYTKTCLRKVEGGTYF